MTKPQDDMNLLRDSINQLDAQMLDTLAQRKELAKKIGQRKFGTQSAIRDKDYEQLILADRIQKGRALGLDANYVVHLFNTIIEDSVLSQHVEFQARANPGNQQDIYNVTFLGEKGSYSHQAAERYFSRHPGKVAEHSCGTFKEAVERVESGQANYAILPIENSTSGGINEVYDLLQYTSLSIVGEIIQPIEHRLLSPFADATLDEITTLLTHPQVHAQCSQFIAKLHNVKVEFCKSTSHAMRQAQEANSHAVAAIGGAVGGSYYNLVPIHDNLANQRENHSRFIILAKDPQKVAGSIPAKTSLLLSTKHEPGALVEALLTLKNHGINMTKLESRPINGNPWEEMFYIDVEENLEDPDMEAAIEELRQQTRFFKVLGCYPDAAVDPTEPTSKTLSRRSPKADKKKVPATPKTDEKPLKKKAYHLVSRQHQAEDTIIQIGDAKIGGDSFVTIAGPCAVESEEQIFDTARQVKEYGGALLRGGCFKPRTNPYSFQGMGYEGLDLLEAAGKKYRMPIVTEVMDAEDVVKVARQADMLQIGARNMQNFSLLKEVGKVHRPVFLKRGLMASLDELLNAAEYILAQGNKQVILCERGIRTFETATRNTLDLSAVPILKQETHLPIMIDPSHAVGRRDLVAPMAKAAKAVGAHGIMVEIHPNPEVAKSDGPQALRFPQYAELMADLYGED